MDDDYVRIRLHDLTDQQLHHYLILLLKRQERTLKKLEKYMADLTSSVADLKAAVDNMAIRFASQIAPLTEALAAAQSSLAEMTALDEADKAALTEALNNAQSAADAIQSEVAELNSIGAAPDVPVEPVPVEELPPAPSEG